MRRGTLVWPLILITLGVLFLLGNFGIIGDVGEFIRQWWPMILILIGLEILIGSVIGRGRSDTQTLSLDLGSVAEAEVKVDFGAGKLRIGAAPVGKLVDGVFEGGLSYDASPSGRVHLRNEFQPIWFGWWGGRGFDWQVGLTREVPLKLRVDSGAADSNLDLSELRVIDFELHTGASSTTVRFPQAAGHTRAKVEAGAASVKLFVPDGVAARIRTDMGLGSSDIDQRRFPRSGNDYVSPDYDAATNKIDIKFEGGVGSLVVS